eukprot:Nitzschia sp. Nitz4//scaffold79_size90958//84388//85728//NITZ4_005041-RA/size90958-processed-gene-0.123-mRNA-1//-1//CDS//3329558297//7025//frame0
MDPPSVLAAPSIKPSGLEVDFDKNITALYKAITACSWGEAVVAVDRNPEEAKTWVVRHYEEDNQGGEQEIMWRFLPIHSACARQPPASLISALLKAYPEGAKCVDDQGMYALHYACGNQASREVIRMLLMNFPEAAKIRDPRGMLPIHYLACWGPSSISVVDMVLVANRDIGNAKDEDGNTPLSLAMEGEYSEKEAVVAALQRWLDNGSTRTSTPTALKKILNGDTFADEKKEGEHSAAKSSHTIGRMRQEINSLRTNQRSIESNWEERMSTQTKNSSARLSELEKKVKMLEAEVSDRNNQVRDLEISLERKDDELREALEEVKLKNDLVENAYDERDGLRQTLADLTEQHDRFKKKSEILTDRLGSLNASLYSMMDEQHVVMEAMKSREEQWMALCDLRREKMKELIALEEQETNEEVELKACMLRQTKEMEAISAVIAAVRQTE